MQIVKKKKRKKMGHERKTKRNIARERNKRRGRQKEGLYYRGCRRGQRERGHGCSGVICSGKSCESHTGGKLEVTHGNERRSRTVRQGNSSPRKTAAHPKLDHVATQNAGAGAFYAQRHLPPDFGFGQFFSSLVVI